MSVARAISRTWRPLAMTVAAIALGALGNARLHAASAGGGGDAPVVMSPYEVSAASVDFQGWRKLRSPHFILYSDAKPKEARDVLRQLEMLRAAMQSYLRRKALKVAPVIVVLPTGRSDWRKIQRKDGVQWQDGLSDPAGRLVHLLLAQYEWQDHGLYLVHGTEFARAQLGAMNLRGPFWFEEGLGMVMEAAEVRKDTVAIGHANSRIRHVVAQGWLAWERFFQVDGKSPEYTQAGEVHRLLGQQGIFTQYMLTHVEPVWVERWLMWSALSAAGNAPSEAEFQRVFGHTWASWQKLMEDYLARGRFQVATMKFTPAGMNFPMEEETPPVREMRELFVLSQILNQSIPASAAALDALLAKGLKSAPLRELLAEACLKWERSDRALQQLRELIEERATNPAIYAVAAQRRFAQAIPQRTIQARLGAEADEIRAWCREALKLEPGQVAANNLLAWTEALAPELAKDAVPTIENIYRTLSRSVPTGEVVTAMAVAMWREGKTGAARGLAAKLLESPYCSAEQRQLARALIAELDATGGSETAGVGRSP